MGDSELVRWCVACFVTDLSENESVENCLSWTWTWQAAVPAIFSTHTFRRPWFSSLVHYWQRTLYTFVKGYVACRQAAFHYLFNALPLAQFCGSTSIMWFYNKLFIFITCRYKTYWKLWISHNTKRNLQGNTSQEKSLQSSMKISSCMSLGCLQRSIEFD